MEPTDSNKEQIETEDIYAFRFYPEEFPAEKDLVMCKFLESKDDGALVSLLEFQNKTAWIQSTVMSRKKVYTVSKALMEGKTQIFQVIRCDTKRGFIDLSKRQVENVDEVKEVEEHFHKAKTVQSILSYFAAKQNRTLEEMCEMISFPFYNEDEHPYDFLKKCLEKPNLLDRFDLSEEDKTVMMGILKHRLSPPPVKIKAEVKLTCYEYNGIEVIKQALIKASEVKSENITVNYRIIGSPLHECSTETTFSKEGLKVMRESLAVLEKEIKANGGGYVVHQEPKALGKADIVEIDDELNNPIEEEEDNDEGIREAEVVLNE